MEPTELERGKLGVILGSSISTAAVASSAWVAVLLRHEDGDGRFVPAHLVDHRNHMAALLDAGCDRVLSINSVGSLRADWGVGTVVAPDDFFAPAVNPSMFDDERGHSVPGFDLAWRQAVVTAWNAGAPRPLVDGGTYAHTRGPRFETPAEVRMLAAFADVVGMTMAAECILAREVGLPYAAVCVVDNLANGLATGHAVLTVEELADGQHANRDEVEHALVAVVAALATAVIIGTGGTGDNTGEPS